MIVQLANNKSVDLSKGMDISIPLTNSENNPRAWYVNPPTFEPVRENGWVGSVAEGGAVNFRNIFFNPHGHGTHTECLGHITKEIHSINHHLKTFFFLAKLISIIPEKQKHSSGDQDLVITRDSLKQHFAQNEKCEALIIRTLPNSDKKTTTNYSDTNPPYLSTDCIDLLEQHGVNHLLIDLPSVDREADGGALAFHHAFWKVPENPQFHKTITELVFVPNSISDGNYLLNLQVAPFENDAAPSRPVLYKMLDF